jgi:site-specific DNA-cytosine methylase
MWGDFTKAVNIIKPKAFVAENVLGLLNPKFDSFVKKYIIDALKGLNSTRSKNLFYVIVGHNFLYMSQIITPLIKSRYYLLYDLLTL